MTGYNPTIIERERWCRRCRSWRMCRQTNFDANRHVILTILSCGLWLPVLVCAGIWHGMSEGLRCVVCGQNCKH